MFQYLKEDGGDIVAIRTSGKLDKNELDALLPQIEERIKKHGKINFFWEMVSFEGWTTLGFLQDRLFDIKHANDFRKIAMVGEKKWEEIIADVLNVFTHAQLKYFDVAQRQEALEWIMANEGGE